MGVYVCGGVCGAHLNPSVTIALALFGDFDKRKVVPYILVQMVAGFCAAALAYAMYYNLFADAVAATAGDPAKLTALAGVFCTFPHPKITFFQAFFVELVITAVLMCLIYALVDGRNTAPKGNLGGLLIGLLVALIGASFGPLTGFAMNAARDFGPRLFAALAGWGTDVMTGYPLNDNLSLSYFLVPLIAPIIADLMGPEVALIDPGRETALAARDALASAGLLREGRAGTARYYVSDTTESFAQLSDWFLGEYAGGPVTRISVDGYPVEQGAST